MATSEALIKYYNCLKDSFNKIQEKNNIDALNNGALRPKLQEEFEKSKDVLLSYLDYLQVYCLIYDDTFSQICSNVIVPLFKTYPIRFDLAIDDKQTKEEDVDKSSIKKEGLDVEVKSKISEYTTLKIHHTIQTILLAKKDLSLVFISQVMNIYPHVDSDSYLIYTKNCLYMTNYLDDKSSYILLSKIIEKVNPPIYPKDEKQDDRERLNHILDQAYDTLYEFIGSRDRMGENIVRYVIKIFIKDHLVNVYDNCRLNYLILYICSKDSKYVDLLLESLWNVFIDHTMSIDERVASVEYASSFVARANYVILHKMVEFLQKASQWCKDIVDQLGDSKKTDKMQKEARVDKLIEKSDNLPSTDVHLFNVLAQSIFYLITQRHRELYEPETIDKMKELKLGRLLKSSLNPLQNCESSLCHRFQEVATLYHIEQPEIILTSGPDVKRQRLSSGKSRISMKIRFEENPKNLPNEVKNLYRSYYDHRNFTIYRE